MTVLPAPAPATRAGAPGATVFRPEIQGLRALAVMAVLLYHLWDNRIRGGYVGVDVFFVVSGYLITAHLLAEIAQRGTVRVTAFWARRIRRLLPASFAVLVATLVVVFVAVPENLLPRFTRDLAASAAYVVNWLFAYDSIDYLAQDDSPSVVQHYWSLSVEEQFYVAWPLLLVGVLWLARRRAAARTDGVLALVAVALVVSFAASVVLTSLLPGPAYFNTGVRAWEFLAGGLVAVLGRRHPGIGGSWRRRRLGVALAWVGIVLILVAVFTFDDSTPFPGFAALLPVSGTALAIAAGGNGGRLSVRRVSGIAPIRWLGDWSYSIYLWHWPMIVLFPLVTHQPITTVVAIGIVGASIVLGALSKRFVEDPLRRPWGPRPRREFVVAVVVPIILIGIAASTTVVVQQRVEAAAAAIAEREASPCWGARATTSPACDPFQVDDPIDTAFASTDLDSANWCLTQLLEDWRTCVWGDPDGPEGTMAFVGDSHAAAMVPAFDQYFGEHGWRVESFFRFGCPGLTEAPIGLDWDDQMRDSCSAWSGRVIDEVLERDDISVVVFTDFSFGYYREGTDPTRLRAADVSATWSRLVDAGKTVIWVDDIPWTDSTDIPTCLSSVEVPAYGPCSVPREIALHTTDVRIAAAETPGVRTVETADLFCDAETCYSVIGGVVAYADNNHMSGTYARSIAPYLGDRVLAQIEDAAAGTG